MAKEPELKPEEVVRRWRAAVRESWAAGEHDPEPRECQHERLALGFCHKCNRRTDDIIAILRAENERLRNHCSRCEDRGFVGNIGWDGEPNIYDCPCYEQGKETTKERVATLTRERDEALMERDAAADIADLVPGLQAGLAAANEARERADRQALRFRTALARFGQHSSSCSHSASTRFKFPCNCGLVAAFEDRAASAPTEEVVLRDIPWEPTEEGQG